MGQSEGKNGFTPAQKWEIATQAGWCCERCGRKDNGAITFHCHHKIPVSKGGESATSNGMYLCVFCHARVHEDNGEIAAANFISAHFPKYPSFVELVLRVLLTITGSCALFVTLNGFQFELQLNFGSVISVVLFTLVFWKILVCSKSKQKM